MKKILFINFGNTINVAGGATKVLCEMANEFVERGYDCKIICCDNTEGTLFFPLISAKFKVWKWLYALTTFT